MSNANTNPHQTKPQSRANYVVTKTPLRVSFVGGGSDILEFYTKSNGAVISSAINRYVYVTAKRHGTLFNEPYRFVYSEIESGHSLEAIKNQIARECLRLVPIDSPVFISSISDLPDSSGLGSSSAFAVGLLNALHHLRGENVSQIQLAEEACQIELEKLHRSVGKQDKFSTAIGGLKYLEFDQKGQVTVTPIELDPNLVRDLFDHFELYWTGKHRDASKIYSKFRAITSEKFSQVSKMRDLAQGMYKNLPDSFLPKEFCEYLNQCWKIKSSLTDSMTDTEIENWYQTALQSGAMGGKLCGAGGGGFLLFVSPPEKQSNLRSQLGLESVKIQPDFIGSQVICKC